ncbi:MAG: hypothetical protein JXA90_01580, partial [Planctomycetes bacterium]|nr:hypothetical protein [Planctomycetota bacterium]
MRIHKTAALALLPAAAVILVHIPSLPGDFIFDDTLMIERGTRLRELDLQRIFWDNYWGTDRLDLNYRPLLLFTFAANFLAGESALAFRIANLALAALTAVLAFFVLRRLLEDDLLASLGATLYAVLPIHSEAVAWIVGRGELLAAAAVLAAWWIALKEPDRRRLSSPILVAALVFLGLCAKESAVVAVPFILAAAFLARRRGAWKTAIVPAIAGCTAIAVYLVVRRAALAEEFAIVAEGRGMLVTRIDNPLHSSFCDAPARIANGLRLLGHYAAKTIVPLRLSADYSYDQIPVLGLGSARLWIEIAAFAVPAAAGVVFLWRRVPSAALGLLVFGAGFAATSNILFPIGTIFAERLAFLPSLGFPLLVCGLLDAALRRGAVSRRSAAILLLVIIGLYGARTAHRARDWKDRGTLYAATARDSPRSTRAVSLGAVAVYEKALAAEDPDRKRRLLEDAMVQTRRALEIDEDNARARGQLGTIAFTLGVETEAQGSADVARRMFQEAESHFSDALDALRRGLQSEPRYYLERGKARLRQGKTREALEDFDEHLRILESRGAPVDATAFNFRGLARGMLSSEARREGRLEDAKRLAALARSDLDEAIRRRSDLPEVYNNRGYLRFLAGD